MLNLYRLPALLATLIVFVAVPVVAAPFSHWRAPLRSTVTVPLRILDRLRGPKIPLRPEARMVELAGLTWHADYSAAWKEAKKEQKLLLVMFNSGKPSKHRQAVLDLISKNADVAKQLKNDFVLASVPMDETIVEKGRRIRLISHRSMHEMHGFEGISIVDLKNQKQPYFGYVVSAYPFMNGKFYHFRAADLPVILNLPPGTITQRTMVWAVRVHPERPASTTGNASTVLSKAAESHSHYQAQIGAQGHYQWESRFHSISGKLNGYNAPIEIVAESWPNQTMIDSCVDCVASWRHSSGHWNAVRSPQGVYGYDIKRGNNGIWYGTGIFAR